MGTGSSKTYPPRNNNERVQRMSRRLSGHDKIQSIINGTRMLQAQINNFRGTKNSNEYTLLLSLLSKNSQEVQEMKRSSKTKKKDTIYDNAMSEINAAIRSLEDKVLDSAAVESSSFINQDVSKLETQKVSERSTSGFNDRRMNTLSQIETQVNNLEGNIRQAIDKSDFKTFPVLEKKIEIIYTDLELVRVDNNLPMKDAIIKLGERLIKYNNRLKRAKRNSLNMSKKSREPNEYNRSLLSKSMADLPKTSQDDNMSEIMRVEAELSDLEIKVSLFDDVKESRTYIELSNSLKQHWTNLHNLIETNEDVKKRMSSTIDVIRKILNELNRKANENSELAKKISYEFSVIEEDIIRLGEKVGNFYGDRNSSDYESLDQNLRKHWAKISEYPEMQINIKERKQKTIKQIQDILKLLNDKVINNSNLQDNTNIVKEVEQFYSQWNSLQHNIENLDVDQNEEVKGILQKFQTEIHNVLIQKSRSTENLLDLNRKHSVQVIDQLIDEMASDKFGTNKSAKIKSTGNNTKNYSTQDIDGIKPQPQTYYYSFVGQGEKQKSKSMDQDINLISNKTRPVSENYDNTISLLPHQNIDTTDSTSLTKEPVSLKQSSITKIEPATCSLPLDYAKYLNSSIPEEENYALPAYTESSNNQEKVTTKKIEPKENNKDSTQIKTLPAVNNFGKLHSILKQIDKIQQDIKQFEGSKDSEQYFEFEIALTKLKSELDDMPSGDNNTISIAKTKVTKKVHDAAKLLDDKVNQNMYSKTESIKSNLKRKSVQKKLDEIMDIDSKVHRLDEMIQTLSSTSSDKEFSDALSELDSCQHILENIDNGTQSNITTSKREVLEHIKKLREALTEKKKLQQQSKDANDLRAILHRALKVKKKVECFSGTYKNVQYLQIEKELQNCLEQINEVTDDNPKIVAAKEQLKEKVTNYLNILEERSVKIDEHDTSIDVGYGQIENIRAKILELKEAAEQFQGMYNDEMYLQIASSLYECNDKLNLISDKHKSVYDSKKLYKDYIKDLLKYLEEKSKINVNGINLDLGIPTDETELILDKYNRELDQIKIEIDQFNGLRTSPNYIKLDERLTNLLLEVEKVESTSMTNKTIQQNIKIDITKYAQLLENKVRKDVEEMKLQSIKKRSTKLNDDINKFSGGTDHNDYGLLFNSIRNLNQSLENLNVDQYGSISQRKGFLIIELQHMEQLLITKATQQLPNNYLSQEIITIKAQLKDIGDQVRTFCGFKNDDIHTYLDEALINIFLRVDNLDTKDEEAKLTKQSLLEEIKIYMQILDKNTINNGAEVVRDFYDGTEV